MHKRILVPLDDSAPVEAGVLCVQNRVKFTRANIVLFTTPQKIANEFSFSNSSFTSCFMDGKEAKKHIYPKNHIKQGGRRRYKDLSFHAQSFKNRAFLAVSDATIVYRKGNPHPAPFQCTRQFQASLIRCVTRPVLLLPISGEEV